MLKGSILEGCRDIPPRRGNKLGAAASSGLEKKTIDRHQQDLNLRPQRGTDTSFESVAVTTWL